MENNKNVGILLANLGTPEAPTSKAVKAFLAEFLHDHRVIDLTRWLWCPLLHGIILPRRSTKVAKLYQSIWMDGQSPLMFYAKQQKLALEKSLNLPVELGMTYGMPNMQDGIEKLMVRGCDKILFFPLYPQYSATTTAAAFDALARALKKKPALPELRVVHHYFDFPSYIDALAKSIEQHWLQFGKPDQLLCSYHGIPKRYVENGDPYYDHCLQTTEKLVVRLNTDINIATSFQSRFGKEEWLQPYTDETLANLPKEGIKRVDIITPAFAVDCLETLEEISVEGKKIFMDAGGEKYRFIPCLNQDEHHIYALKAIVQKHIKDW